ncbi:MAG: MurR/RpiR family transcriptional regulator [bacterium]|nr:MAG: MurR/RpiR family transcriptional regulator [bacterium]
MNEANLTRIPRNCVLQLLAVYDNLKSAERKAADFILADPERISGLGIVEFATDAGCSEATVVRLSRRLGYEGYPELKREFESYLSGDRMYEYDNIARSDPPVVVLKKVFESSVTAIQDTLQVIDPAMFQKAADAMITAGRLMFCGVGDAAAVAMEAYQRFIRIGQTCFFSLDPDAQLIMANQMDPGDVIVAISHSGRSRSVVDAVKAATDRGALAVAITNFPVSPLTKKSDIVLQTAVFSKTTTGEVMAKRLTALCIIESLYINFCFAKESSCLPVLEKSNEIVGINKL